MRMKLFKAEAVATYEKNGALTAEVVGDVFTHCPKKNEVVSKVGEYLASKGITNVISIVVRSAESGWYNVDDDIILSTAVEESEVKSYE